MKTGIYSKARQRLIKRLIHARKQAGLNQTKAAKKLGRTQTYLSKIEVGQRKIDALELKQLSVVYKKPVSYFLH